ncbi:benzoate transporter [Sinorhizobium meliloti]|nr:benzoate transporter [Sinorhizobium meliloti AK83]ASP60669.1 benzoate transporter [Sinorhizobium meliloti]TWA94028.1 hypothetical protein FB000_124120 [Ensifer sp. SEMIA 134]TWB30035.1 hypothetical protein FB001_12111 [Ensifer sp. SEMIA 135]RMI16578.1 benzoate transporter [Sinorhizobium meliloti]
MHKVWGVSGLVELCAKRVESTESEAAATIAGLLFSFGTNVAPLKGGDLVGDFVLLDSSR